MFNNGYVVRLKIMDLVISRPSHAAVKPQMVSEKAASCDVSIVVKRNTRTDLGGAQDTQKRCSMDVFV